MSYFSGTVSAKLAKLILNYFLIRYISTLLKCSVFVIIDVAMFSEKQTKTLCSLENTNIVIIIKYDFVTSVKFQLSYLIDTSTTRLT